MPTTSWPLAASASARCDPMNPAAPVTAYRTGGGYRPLLVEPVDTCVADQVEPLGVDDNRRVLAVRERPEEVAGARVERVRAPLQRREVHPARDHRGRAGDRPIRVELPLDLARDGVEAEERAGVRACEHAPAPHGGGRIDVPPRRARPEEIARRRAVRIFLAVGRADEHAPVGHRGRRVELAGVAEARLARRLPDQPAGGGVEGVDVRVVGAEEEPVAGDGEPILHLAAGGERPAELAGLLRVGVDATVPVADVDVAAVDERRGLRRADRVPPQHLPGPDRQGEHFARQVAAARVARRPVEERDEEHVVRDRRRHRLAAVRRISPRTLPGLRADGVHDPVVVREEEASVRDRGRELDQAASAERPDLLERRRERDAVREAQALRVIPVCRPRNAGLLRHGLRDLRRHELLRRRAADVAALVAHVQVVRDACPDRAQHDRHRDREQPPPHRAVTAYSREYPSSRSLRPSPETGTYWPCGKSSTTLPLRASTPTIRCEKEPAYATPSTTAAAPEIGPPVPTDQLVPPVAALSA